MVEISSQEVGILTVIIIQAGQSFRSWLVNRKSNTKLDLINERISAVEEKVEHTNFIPSFEVDFGTFINKTISAFKYKNKIIKNFLLTGANHSKEVFIDVLKLGFGKNFNIETVKTNFYLKEITVRGIFTTGSLDLNKKEVENIIYAERNAFLLKLEDLVHGDKKKKNGERQSEFQENCEDFILNIVKNISKL